MEIPRRRMEHITLEKTIKGNKFNSPRKIHGPKQTNFNTTDKKVMEFPLEKPKYRPPANRETTQTKASGDVTFVNITQQDTEPSNRRATRLVHSQRFAPQW